MNLECWDEIFEWFVEDEDPCWNVVDLFVFEEVALVTRSVSCPVLTWKYMADALAKVSSHVFGWGQINLQVRRLASWKQHRQMESCQHQFWEGTHILETKVKLSIVTHGAAVPWPSWNIEKVRDFSHSEKRMAEELKLDKGTDSSWKELWTGEKFYTSTIQLEWWRETIKSWHLFLTFILRRQMKQYM